MRTAPGAERNSFRHELADNDGHVRNRNNYDTNGGSFAVRGDPGILTQHSGEFLCNRGAAVRTGEDPNQRDTYLHGRQELRR